MGVICPKFWFLHHTMNNVFSQPVWMWCTNVPISFTAVPAEEGWEIAMWAVLLSPGAVPYSKLLGAGLCSVSQPSWRHFLWAGFLSNTSITNHPFFCFCLDYLPLLLPQLFGQSVAWIELDSLFLLHAIQSVWVKEPAWHSAYWKSKKKNVAWTSDILICHTAVLVTVT